MSLWNWFPYMIFDLPKLTYVASIGLLIMFSMFNINVIKPNEEHTNEYLINKQGMYTSYLLLTLVVGYGFSQLM